MIFMRCLRCGNRMIYSGTHDIQLGRTGWLLGDLPNLMAGSLEVDIYVCKHCNKLEFFNKSELSEEENETKLPQKQCPKCGKLQDFDYPKCPFCDYRYEE